MKINMFAKLFFLGLLLSGCVGTEQSPESSRIAVFGKAVVAAAVPPLKRANPELLQVEGEVAEVVSWNMAKYYPVGPAPLSLTRNVWVTVTPQVQQMCRAIQRGGTVDRMEELLGLAPGDGKGRTMIVMEVSTKDMFRPCPDPSLDQNRCSLSVPRQPDGYPADLWASDLAFVANQMSTSYVQTEGDRFGYPFTRLGYTYDWSADSPTHVGPSEFVVRSEAKVIVKRHVPTAEYCAPPSG